MARALSLPSAASRGGVQLFGTRRRLSGDLVALCTLLVATLLGLMASYARPTAFAVGVAGKYDRLHLQGFHEPEAMAGEQQVSYRWTEAESLIEAPALGRGLWETTVALGSPQPAGQPKQVVVDAGETSWSIQLEPQQRFYHLFAPSSGDMRVRLSAPAAQYGADPRSLAVVFGGAQFQPLSGDLSPPLPLLVHILVALLLMYLTQRLIGLYPATSLLLPLGAVGLLALGVTIYRAPVGMYSLRIMAMAMLGLLLMLALRWALPRLYRQGGVEISSGMLTSLLALIYASFLFKAAGLLWPYFLAVDIEWHMEKTRRVLTGRIGELWRADSPFHQSVMPELWGQNKPVIPYSPFYHIFSAIWVIFPWQLETSANIFSAVIDSLRPAMIFFIVRKFGFRERAALIGALTYLLIPATFLMHAWGNTPTTNGMWWSLLSVTVVVGSWERLRVGSRSWVVLTLVLGATMLFYAVTAVFTTLLVGGLALGLIVTGRRQQGWPLLLSLLGAIALSTGIYYWQFIGPIIARTIPKFTGAIQQGGKELGVVPISWPEYLWKYVYLLDIYGMYLALPLGIAGWWLGVRAFGARSAFALLMTIWMVIAIVFWFVGFRVDMVDKQLFWLMPWMGIGAGIAVDRLLDRPTAARWGVPLLVLGAFYFGSDALYLWSHRLRGLPRSEGFTSWFQLLSRML